MGNGKPDHIKLGIGDSSIPLHSHIAHFVQSDEDFAAALAYLEEGLRGTDHCVIFGHAKANRQVSRILSEHGFDIAELTERGRVAFVGGLPTADAIVEAISDRFRLMMDAGAKVIRLLGNIGWLEQGWPSVQELVAMEAKVTLAAENYPCVILCLYDLRSIPSVIMQHGAMESHPLTLCGCAVRENPLAVPTEAALGQLDGLSQVFLALERKKEALQLYQKVFANMRDPLVIVRLDPDKGTPAVVELNPAAQNLSGRSYCVDLTLGDCFPGLFDADFLQTCLDIASSGGSLELSETAIRNSFYQIKVFSLSESYLGLLFNDITQRKRTEKALLSLRRLSSMLQSSLEMENILDELIKGAAGIVGAEDGVAAVCATEELACHRYLVKGVLHEEQWQPEQGVPGRVYRHEAPHLCNDPRHDPFVDTGRAERYGVRNLLSTPILDVNGQMLGFLEMHNKSDGSHFTLFDQDQLASAAQTAALAVRNAGAFRKITQMGVRLRESTQRYRDLVEGLDAIVWEADAETFRFTFVSRIAETILGYPIAQWLEEPNFWVEHIHPEDRQKAVASCRQATAQAKHHRFVYRALAADGRSVWMRDHVRVGLDEQGRVRQLRGVMVDITETMAIEDSLRKSEAKFRSTFEGAGIGMALLDLEGKMVETNPALQAMLGYSGLDLAGAPFATICHPDDAGLYREKFQELMEGKLARYQVEKRFLGKEQRELCGRVTVSAVRFDGGTQYAIAMVEDITERMRAEKAVAQLLAQVQRDAAELEERVAERTSQLEETNAELDSFAHSVSHDLRAPLRAMQGYVEILIEEETDTSSERFAYLKRILTAAQGMDRLIQNLLAYSRLSRQDIMLQSVSLDQVVRDAVGQLELASGGKKYQLEVAWGLPDVIGHQAVLVQVVLNLLTNGIKFVPSGVTPRLRIWAEPGDGVCRLFVQDNGIGIAPEHQERIFKIFERLHGIETYPGTGVGLAIVRKAVTRLGGRIGVESREGEGSRFWVELPMAAREGGGNWAGGRPEKRQG